MNQQERDTAFSDFGNRLTSIEVAIVGNGTKGLAERMTDVENKTKPPDRRTIIAQRAFEVSVMAVVIGLIINWNSIAGFFIKLF